MKEEYCEKHPKIKLVSVIDDKGEITERCGLCDIGDLTSRDNITKQPNI